MSFKNAVATLSMVAAVGLSVPLHAASISVAPGFAEFAPTPTSGQLAGGTEVATSLVSFSAGSLSGQLGSKVFSGVTSNPHGLSGLTFVYELSNLSSALPALGGAGEGISDFSLSGWDGFLTDFAQGTGSLFGFTGPQVLPEVAERSGGVGSNIHVTFPPDQIAPPIFSGETSFQLIFFTDATAFYDAGATIRVDNYNTITYALATGVSTFAAVPVAASVPDGATTAVLLGLGFLSLGAFARQSKRA